MDRFLYRIPETAQGFEKLTTDIANLKYVNILNLVVRMERLELSQETYWNLNPARLPVPPHSHFE
jgi:hypothetical protein